MILFYLISRKTVANLKRNRTEWKNIGMKKKESMPKLDKRSMIEIIAGIDIDSRSDKLSKLRNQLFDDDHLIEINV